MERITRHKTTARTEPLIRDLIELAREIDHSLLDAASEEARAEWSALCEKWPTIAEVRSGSVGLSDDELEGMLAKVVRFKAILYALARPLFLLLIWTLGSLHPDPFCCPSHQRTGERAGWRWRSPGGSRPTSPGDAGRSRSRPG